MPLDFALDGCIINTGIYRNAMEKPVHTTLNLPPDLTRKALEKARAEGRNLSFVVIRFLSAWVAGEIDLPEVTPEKKPKKSKP